MDRALVCLRVAGALDGMIHCHLLCVMAMEYLSRLFIQASQKQGLKFHPHCTKLQMVHLMFADDLIIFCGSEFDSIRNLIDAFAKFTACTGLTANKDKSQVVIGGCNQEQTQ